ncbi:MAG: hypothetical protein JNM30_13350 [Rhodospirillales bacterium]|nr:hypothetical protein [Rhodospirillales bacterium]
MQTAITASRSAGPDSVSRRYRRYRRAVFAGAIGFAAILAAAVAFLAWQSRETTLRAAEEEGLNLSVALSELVARSVESVDILLRGLRETALQQPLDNQAHLARLSTVGRERIYGLPPVRALVVIDAGGDIVSFSRGHPPPKVNVVDRDYFIAARDQKADSLVIGTPTLNRINGEWTINLARRISGPDGAFLGVVLATLEPLYYEQVFAAINLTPGGTIALFSTDGVLMARHPHAAERMGKPIGDTSFRRELMRSDGQATTRGIGGIDGIPRVIAGRFLRDIPLYIAVSQSEHLVLSDWRQDTWNSAILVSTVLCALGLLAHLLLYQLGKLEVAERAIIAARHDAERASRAKSAFLANMSHELRTPLNAIVGFAELLDSKLFGPMPHPKQHEYLKDIRASGEHLRDLVSDILDLAKIEAEKWTLNPAVVDARVECEQVAAIMHGLADRKRVALALALPDGAIEAYADPRVLRQMLINLVGNAIKFTPEGGTVTIEAHRRDGACEFVIRDTGVGIKPQDIARVLEPFEQGDSMMPRPGKETGLGLALTKAFAELHGGTLALESTVGVGTTITVTLPAAPG